MEKDEFYRMCQYLDIVTEEKKIDLVHYPLLIFELLACAANYTNISFMISLPCAIVISIGMFIWGQRTKENNKLLYLYLGVGISLWSLCCMALLVGFIHTNLLDSLIIFIALFLSSVPFNIYLVKRNAMKILNGKSSSIDTMSKSFYGGAGGAGLVVGGTLGRVLNRDGKAIVGIVTGGMLAYFFQYAAIRYFYKYIIRIQYKIDECLIQQKSNLAKRR